MYGGSLLCHEIKHRQKVRYIAEVCNLHFSRIMLNTALGIRGSGLVGGIRTITEEEKMEWIKRLPAATQALAGH